MPNMNFSSTRDKLQILSFDIIDAQSSQIEPVYADISTTSFYSVVETGVDFSPKVRRKPVKKFHTAGRSKKRQHDNLSQIEVKKRRVRTKKDPKDLAKNRPDSFFCNLCEFSCKFRSKMSFHLESSHTHRDSWIHSCGHCSKKFAVSLHLRRHIKNVHKEESYAFCCKMCGVKFLKFRELVQHRHDLKHFLYIRKTEWKCQVRVACGQSFPTREEYDEHYAKCHRFECAHACCNGLWFSKKRALDAHDRRYHQRDESKAKVSKKNIIKLKQSLLEMDQNAVDFLEKLQPGTRVL